MNKIRKILILATFIIFMFLIVSNVSAAQYNINNMNSSESVSDLLDFDIEDGDTLFLEDGVYNNFYLSFRNSINVKANPGKVFLKGSGSGFGIDGDSNYINITNIHLSNYDVGIVLSGSSFSLINVTSSNNKEFGICIVEYGGTTVLRNVVANNNGENGVEISDFNKVNIYNLTTNSNKGNGLVLAYGAISNIHDSTFNNNGDSGIDISDYDTLNIHNSKAVGNTYSLYSMYGNYNIHGSDFKNIFRDGDPVNNVPKVANKAKFMSIILKIKKDIYYHKICTIANIGKASGSKNFKIKIPKGYTLLGYSVNTRVIATYSGLSSIINLKIDKLGVYNGKSGNLALIYLVLVKNNKKGFAPVKMALGKGYRKLSASKFKISGLGTIKYKSYIKGKNSIKVNFYYKGVPFRAVEFKKVGSKITTITKHIVGTKTKQSISTNVKITTYFRTYMNILKKTSKII